MNLINDVPIIIGNKVRDALKERRMTVRSCADAFNYHYSTSISKGKKKTINKDTIQRIRSGKFSLPNSRVSELCDFLNIDLNLTATVSDETQLLESILVKQSELRLSLKTLLQRISENNGDNNEVY